LSTHTTISSYNNNNSSNSSAQQPHPLSHVLTSSSPTHHCHSNKSVHSQAPVPDAHAALTLALSQASWQQQETIAHHLGALSSCGVKLVDISGFLQQLGGHAGGKQSSASAGAATSAHHHPFPPPPASAASGPATICDFSPEWAYTEVSHK
jgi:hypothetical protein